MTDAVAAALPGDVRCVLFDLYETLVGIDWDAVHAGRARIAEAAGVAPDAMMRAYQRTLPDRTLGRFGDHSGDLAAVFAMAGLRPDRGLVGDAAEAEVELWRRGVVVYADAKPCLEALRRRGLRLGLVSNCTAVSRRLIEEWQLVEHFDTVVLSCEVGLAKPDPAIFAVALQRLAGDAGSSLFVDDVPAFLAAAVGVGMATRLIARSGPAAAGRHPVISTLAELTG